MTTFLEAVSNFVSGTSEATAKQIALGSAVELVRLLNSKQCDLSTTVPTMDGETVTFGEILDSRQEGVTRRNGTVGTDYVEVHRLSHDTASEVITALKAAPNKSNSFAGKPKKNNSATPKESPEATIENMVANALVKFLPEIAAAFGAPKVAEGHTVVETPASPVVEIKGSFAPGDIIEVNGVAVQISTDGKRLNKTIV